MQTATVAPFDRIASDYDDQFSQTTLAGWLREQVWERLNANFKKGDHVLELGCGTGEDAVWLAQQGISVTATDHSVEMLQTTQGKSDRHDLGNLVQTRFVDLNEPLQALETSFDGVFANFGVLNCVRNRRPLADFLAARTSTGARAVFIVMSPYCPWEMFWHLLHGKPKKAFRRFRKNGLSADIGGTPIEVWYPKPTKLISDFEHHFRATRLQGLGVFLPPSYLKNLVERFPRSFRLLLFFEKQLRGFFPWNWLNDHYILELIRK